MPVWSIPHHGSAACAANNYRNTSTTAANERHRKVAFLLGLISLDNDMKFGVSCFPWFVAPVTCRRVKRHSRLFGLRPVRFEEVDR
jgi:hypothetical protein